jgi:hypothetical protein
MSTPIPPNSRVDGLELYAPRRARAQSVAGDQKQSFADDQAQPAAGDQEQSWADGQDSPPGSLTDAPENDQPQVPESDPWEAYAESADAVEARIDNAVEAEFDVEREFREVHIAPLPRAPRLMSSQDETLAPLPRAARLMSSWETYDRPRPSSDLQRHPSDLRRSGRRIDRGAWPNSRLDPDVVPEPPIDTQRRILPLLMRFSLVVGAAAIAAYGFTLMSRFQPQESSYQDTSRQDTSNRDTSHQVASHNAASDAVTALAKPPVSHEPAIEPQLPTRLVVENQHAFVNEPLPLEASVAPSTGDESLVVAGLAAGTRLSAGAAMNESSWRLPSHDLHGLYLYAPKGFVGVMNTAIDVLSPNQRLLDSRSVQLEWVVRKEPPTQRNDTVDPANANVPAAQQIDPEQAAILMKHGRDALASGDIAAARLAFRRLADAGNAEAALGLAATYDPRYLAGQNVIGVTGDEAQARVWYQRAMELGSIEAKNILVLMATK